MPITDTNKHTLMTYQALEPVINLLITHTSQRQATASQANHLRIMKSRSSPEHPKVGERNALKQQNNNAPNEGNEGETKKRRTKSTSHTPPTRRRNWKNWTNLKRLQQHPSKPIKIKSSHKPQQRGEKRRGMMKVFTKPGWVRW